MTNKNEILIASLLLALGLGTSGFFVSQTMLKARQLDRYVTVKGLSEREVEADIAIWPIQLTVVSNNLSDLQDQIITQRSTMQDFFAGYGFGDAEITTSSPIIQDSRADLYNQNTSNPYRYNAKVDITLRTANLQKLQEAESNISTLIGKGIIIGSKNYWQQIEYLYTRLNEIKPAMIEEATLDARKAAEKFAKDSGSKVGKIRTARQGLFSIENRDINTSQIKRVRVVTTVEFYLED